MFLLEGGERAVCHGGGYQIHASGKNKGPRNVLITGANRGIGLEFVKQMILLPVPPTNVLATCRNPDGAKELNEVAIKNSNVKVLKLDVTKEEEINEIVTKTADYLSKDGLNLLINNAGLAHKKQYLGNLMKQSLLEQFDVNIFGPILLTQALLPYLRQAAKSSEHKGFSCNRASVVNITSIMGSIDDNQSGGLYGYRTSKAALNMLTKNMNVDLKPDGILCFCLHPGWVLTDLGGEKAPITTETSVAGMLKVMAGMSDKSDIFVDYNGKTIPW